MDERKSEQSVANEQLVSLSEICEIRAEGCLSSKELLAVLGIFLVKKSATLWGQK